MGFDGGATKTECVLMDEGRTVLASGRSGASNPGRVGFERAVAAIKQAAESAIAEARAERGAIVALCAGIAGTGDETATEKIRTGLVRAFPGVAMKICTDLESALEAAGEGPAIVLIAGTGSAAVGRGVTGEMRRAGGLGPRSGDEGSARDIGKKAVAAAKLRRERTSEESDLGKRLLRQLGVTSWHELKARAGSNPEDAYPQLFPVVANAADAGDELARELLRAAADDLAALVKALVDELSLMEVPFPLAKTGGMMGRCAFFDVELERRLREAAPSATIGFLPISPAHAAALMALELVPERGAGDSNG